MFHSDDSVEAEILKRIDNYVGQTHFPRMLGILMTSGADQSIIQLIAILENYDLDIPTKKTILMAMYKIADRIKIKRRTSKAFDSFLSSSQLDTISKYELYRL
jgi:hypothetical protein